MALMKKTLKMKMGRKSAIGAGVLAAAAAAGAAGYYFYASKGAKRHRQAAAKWAGGLKRDVVREAKKLKKLDRTKLVRVVDEIAKTYENARGLDKKDLAVAVRELKGNWRHLETELKGSGKRTAKKVKEAVRKTKKSRR